MSRGLQGLTKRSFLSRRPDRGDDGLSRKCNVDVFNARFNPGFCPARWWDREKGGILVDLGDQNPAVLSVAPRAVLPLCLTLGKIQPLSSGPSTGEGRQKLSPAAPSVPRLSPKGQVTLARDAQDGQQLRISSSSFGSQSRAANCTSATCNVCVTPALPSVTATPLRGLHKELLQ